MRKIAIPFVLALVCAAAPAGADLGTKTMHCVMSPSDSQAHQLFGTSAPYGFDVVFENPGRIDNPRTAANLAALAPGEVREGSVSPGGIGFKFHASARDGKVHIFGLTWSKGSRYGEFTDYGEGAGRIGGRRVFDVRCDDRGLSIRP